MHLPATVIYYPPNTFEYPINAILHKCHQCEETAPHKLRSFLPPPHATHVSYYANFNHPLPILPHSITHLSFGKNFDQPADDLPSNLKHLQFSVDFNHPVDHLPRGLTHLTFGACFNQPVDYLSPSLVQLKFGIAFNHPLDHLPPSLTELLFPDDGCLVQSLDNLPSSLTRLSSSFKRVVNKLPLSLTQLDISSTSLVPIHPDTNLITFFWPPFLQRLKIGNFLSEEFNLPNTIQSLTLHFKHKPDSDVFIQHLPRSLTHLDLFNTPSPSDWSIFPALKFLQIDTIAPGATFPPHLNELIISSSITNVLIVDSLPLSITRLKFAPSKYDSFTHFPPALTHLTILTPFMFNQPLDHLPPSLLYLEIHSYLFNQPMDHLPSSLHHLAIECHVFNQPLDHLPPFLSHLSISGDSFDQPLHHLPSLPYLSLPRKVLLSTPLSPPPVPLHSHSELQISPKKESII